MNYPKDLNLDLKLNEGLSTYTTFGIGGVADAVARPQNIGQLRNLIKVLMQEKEDFLILGCGSNLLIRDDGFRGYIISLGQGEFLQIEGKDKCLKVGAGLKVSRLLTWCQTRALSGLEFMAGIPASVGGAVRQNAGTNDRSIAEVIEAIDYLDEKLEVKTLGKESLDFSYRHLNLDPKAIISVTLRLKASTPERVKESISHFFNLKKERQPLGKKSAGCVFKNPPFKSAGALIEEAGLKGKRIGGALVSEKHANFIINENKATSKDVLDLIALIKNEVKLKKGVFLEEEINII